MWPKESKNQFQYYQCMDSSIVALSSSIWIDDFFYEYECVGDERKKSSATNLAIGFASLLMVVSII